MSLLCEDEYSLRAKHLNIYTVEEENLRPPVDGLCHRNPFLQPGSQVETADSTVS